MKTPLKSPLRWSLLLIFTILTPSSGVTAVTWQDLQSLCREKPDCDDLYLMGAIEMAILTDHDRPADAPLKLCLPDPGVSLQTSIAIVRKWAAENPAAWPRPATWIIVLALNDAFPCPQHF